MSEIEEPEKKKQPIPVERKPWDEYFMDIVEMVAKQSTCLYRHTGAIIVRDKRIIATGFNGAPPKIEHCIDTGICVKDEAAKELAKQLGGHVSGLADDFCVALHAEQNAIIQCAKYGIPTEGATMYVLHSPCYRCAKMIVAAGIKEVVYKYEYPDERAFKMLRDGKVKVRKLGETQK